jgi:hypothetical protein
LIHRVVEAHVIANTQRQPHSLQAVSIPLLLIGLTTAFVFDSDHQFPLADGRGAFFRVERAQCETNHGQLGRLAQHLRAGAGLCL